jgi:hypothetical protein
LLLLLRSVVVKEEREREREYVFILIKLSKAFFVQQQQRVKHKNFFFL